MTIIVDNKYTSILHHCCQYVVNFFGNIISVYNKLMINVLAIIELKARTIYSSHNVALQCTLEIKFTGHFLIHAPLELSVRCIL